MDIEKRRNRIIAEFMADITDDIKGWAITNKRLVSKMKFHSSWDALMPAYFKFRDTPGGQKHRSWTIKISLCILHEITPAKAAKELAEAIKWYNSTTIR